MNLTKDEKRTLADLLRTEIFETRDLIELANEEDKIGLEKHLMIVTSIFSKLMEKR